VTGPGPVVELEEGELEEAEARLEYLIGTEFERGYLTAAEMAECQRLSALTEPPAKSTEGHALAAGSW
jgi:hypothetical protein